MALILFTRTYAPSYAGYAVVIRDAATNQPARLYHQAKGGLISSAGRVVIPANGVIAVYVRDDAEYKVTLVNQTNGQAINQVLDSAYTWAAKPLASAVPIGTTITITDVGGRSQWYSTGTIWRPVNGSVVIAQSAVAGTPVTGTTTAVDVDLATIPAGLLGPNGVIEVFGTWTETNNANTKTAFLLVSDGTVNAQAYSGGLANITGRSGVGHFQNRGSATSNMTHFNLSSGLGSNGNVQNYTVNTNLPLTVKGRITLSNAADTMTLERWAVVARPF